MANGQLRETESCMKLAVIVFQEWIYSFFYSRRLLGFLSSKNQEISCNYLHGPPFCESKVQRLTAQNQQFRFKLEFKAERVYLKMVQCAIATNQFTAAI